MQSITNKLRPKGGFSHFFHLGLNALLPLVLYVLVSIKLAPLAFAFLFVSKWRMLAVRPRYWLANVRANGVDILFGVSMVTFMTQTNSTGWRLVWAASYVVWLTVIKPASNFIMVSVQALLTQFVALMAAFMWLNAAPNPAPLYGLIIAVWLICYLAARHLMTVFEEPFNSFYSHTWAYFGAALIWVLGHWLLFYGLVAQVTVILTVIGVGLASLYYLAHVDRLNVLLRRQILLIMFSVILVILIFSDWKGKIV